MIYKFQMNKNEYWWGGTSVDGSQCPFDSTSDIKHDFRTLTPNQTMPMYLSNQGRCIWSDEAFRVKIANGIFEIEGSDVCMEQYGNTLRSAYLGAMKKHFPHAGAPLPNEFFEAPQYNTWMQLTYHQTQNGVMQYAKEIIKHGFTPGILMIDEGWQKEYGVWDFDRLKFPEPKKMIDSLHEMGFRVMLWVVPNIRPDGEYFVKNTLPELNPEYYDRLFLRTTEGKIALCNWWNGCSAILDFTKQCDCDFLDRQLQYLIDEYGVDGFKFDGGTTDNYSDLTCENGKISEEYTPTERNIAWNEFGAKYAFHEYKDTFKGGGKRTIQRIRDRAHSWDEDGLSTLIPNALLQGLIGHPFICPDMIGGGMWTHKDCGLPVDEELFVRMAQCASLFPMMQFSWAPWDAVSPENTEHILNAERLHRRFSDTILQLVDDAYQNGEPILRPLEYNYPRQGYHMIKDSFMLGENILVAPIMQKGITTRDIHLPEGNWKGFDGNVYEGGKRICVSVTLADLPYFIKII